MHPARIGYAWRVELKDELCVLKVIHNPLSQISIGNTSNLDVCGLTFAVIAGLRTTNSGI